AAGRACVPGADDLAGLDLQVGHRVGASAVGEQQVAVELIGVGAIRVGADDDVADPDRVRLFALQRALVGDATLAGRRVVIDKQAVLQVLAVIGEEKSEQFGVTAGPGEVHERVDADEVAAKCDDDVLERGVPADASDVMCEMDRVIVPVLQTDEGELRAVADRELDVGGADRRTDVIDDDRGFGMSSDIDGHVPVRRTTLASDGYGDGLVRPRLGGNVDDYGLLDALESESGDALGRAESLSDARVFARV